MKLRIIKAIPVLYVASYLFHTGLAYNERVKIEHLEKTRPAIVHLYQRMEEIGMTHSRRLTDSDCSGLLQQIPSKLDFESKQDPCDQLGRTLIGDTYAPTHPSWDDQRKQDLIEYQAIQRSVDELETHDPEITAAKQRHDKYFHRIFNPFYKVGR